MSSDNNWIDPLYLNGLLTNEEKAIKKTAKDFCNLELFPRVVQDNKNCFFDIIYNYLYFIIMQRFKLALSGFFLRF